MQDIEVSFSGGMKVDAHVGSLVVRTDQPTSLGGEGTAVAPFDLFLASLATCAGYYVLAFCKARNLPIEGIALRQRTEVDEATHLPKRICIELTLPSSFPEKYKPAIVRAAEGCKVKKTLAAAPIVDVALTADASIAHAAP